ncbi:MAG: WecB/TagA/CpsF family glycosyltransferase [Candidatus Berkelbacteria bacterium]|nr:WecB/TagA/CpsF family glycosyltransferase [Candidatus Berkelbacteria bacterium]
MKLNRKKINILGVPIDSFDRGESIRFIDQKISAKKPVFITTVNVEFLFRALNDDSVFQMLKNSSLNFADGIGVLWAAKFLSINLPKDKFWRHIIGSFKLFGSLMSIVLYPKYLKKPIPERISGSDFVWDLSRYAAKNDLRIFLLGGDPTVPEQAALKLQTDIYNLKVAGTFEGSPKPQDEIKILELMKKDKPDILFVAYGVPAEELWLEKNLAKTGAKIGIGVGGTFDFLAGRRKRAPKFVRTIGLEWLWRLILEPRRYRRQTALSKLVWRVFKYKLVN